MPRLAHMSKKSGSFGEVTIELRFKVNTFLRHIKSSQLEPSTLQSHTLHPLHNPKFSLSSRLHRVSSTRTLNSSVSHPYICFAVQTSHSASDLQLALFPFTYLTAFQLQSPNSISPSKAQNLSRWESQRKVLQRRLPNHHLPTVPIFLKDSRFQNVHRL